MFAKSRLFWWIFLAAALAGCTPASTPDTGPRLPLLDPNLLGRPNRNFQRIDTLAALQSCLDAGVSAFGATLQTTNVRLDANVEACRVGKLARGSVVEIVGYTEAPAEFAANGSLASLLPTPTPRTPLPPGPQIGYTEDISPLFERACAACHNAAARIMGLQTTTYPTLMAGSNNGPVVIPGDPENSKLWAMVSMGKMPLTGPLPPAERQLVYNWILAGAAERRAPSPPPADLADTAVQPSNRPDNAQIWLNLLPSTQLATVPDRCPANNGRLVSSDLILPISCGVPPSEAELTGILAGAGLRPQPMAATNMAATNTASRADTPSQPTTSQNAATAPRPSLTAAVRGNILGLPSASEADPYMLPRGGFCLDRHLPNNARGITAITFAEDGRMFLALDSNLASEVDPLILLDAHHPSRSVALYSWREARSRYEEILVESSRVTGLDYADGALYLSRAGEVGRIPDNGSYERLAAGFAVESQLFHANNGIVVNNGWLYLSAGGVRDGYVEGPIVGIGEDGAQNIVSGGNPYAARIVRAPLNELVSQRTIALFSTAARGVRNPYGITADPAGRIWFTDNGATNVPDSISAGDEVNLLDPAAIGGGEGATPYYGFPLALSGSPPDWYSKPVIALVNSAAPTGIAWAYDTIFFGVYGRYPGLYRVGRDGAGSAVAERILHGWPVLAVAAAPDGALWIGMGDGGLYRITPGCNG